jgi:hypothetical protein
MGSIKQIHFFGLRDDLLSLLDIVERDMPLKYVRTGRLPSADCETFLHASEIPDLGTANSDSSTSCTSFLVTRREVSINVRAVKQKNSGVERYFVDQLINPDTVGFTPAGIWGNEVVLSGRLATVSDTATSRDLMKQFGSAFKKQFTKVKAFYVGALAFALLKAGKRLTAAAQCPREFDLTTES